MSAGVILVGLTGSCVGRGYVGVRRLAYVVGRRTSRRTGRSGVRHGRRRSSRHGRARRTYGVTSPSRRSVVGRASYASGVGVGKLLSMLGYVRRTGVRRASGVASGYDAYVRRTTYDVQVTVRASSSGHVTRSRYDVRRLGSTVVSSAAG